MKLRRPAPDWFCLPAAQNYGENRNIRRLSLLVYLLHLWSIVLIGSGAEAWGLAESLVDNRLGHFAAILLLAFAVSLALEADRPIRPNPMARAWKELDQSALRHNAAVLRSRLAPGCELMAVVKADGYGHGGAAAARCLQQDGVRAFAVACLEEGVALRRAGIRGHILILGYTPAVEAPLLRRWRLIQTVADEAHGLALNSFGKPLRVHLAIDTGMHRLGVPAEDTAALARLFQLKNLRVEGVFSHLCVSDFLDQVSVEYTQIQLTRFYAAVAFLRKNGFDPGSVHIQASYGMLNLPPQPCAYARAGIALYGVESGETSAAAAAGLRPALSLRARVVCVRRLGLGECAGYGLAFRAERDTVLAVLSIGYADGLPRELAERGGRVLLRGRFCPMIGRMCMDQLFVDVTGLPDIHPGDVATLIGQDGALRISAEETARRCGTIPNELLSRLGRRVGLVVR